MTKTKPKSVPCSVEGCPRVRLTGFSKELPNGKYLCGHHLSVYLDEFCAVEGCGAHLFCPKTRYCASHRRQHVSGQPLTQVRRRMTAEDYEDGRLQGQEGLTHGTTSMYNLASCRCALCTEAWNLSCRNAKRARVGKTDLDIGDREHGKEVTYQYGCRCNPCRLGHNAYRREADAIRKQRNSMPEQTICDCCGLEYSKRLVTDHEHGTTKIRGLLCQSCNTGIGKLGDNLEGLLKAVDYLKRVT